jgi:hypothetical protein
MNSILKVPIQDAEPAERLAPVVSQPEARAPGTRAAAGGYVKAFLAAVITVAVIGLVSLVGSRVPASALAMVEILGVSALLWLRYRRKKKVGSRLCVLTGADLLDVDRWRKHPDYPLCAAGSGLGRRRQVDDVPLEERRGVLPQALRRRKQC